MIWIRNSTIHLISVKCNTFSLHLDYIFTALNTFYFIIPPVRLLTTTKLVGKAVKVFVNPGRILKLEKINNI
jgi:hypothetical protein